MKRIAYSLASCVLFRLRSWEKNIRASRCPAEGRQRLVMLVACARRFAVFLLMILPSGSPSRATPSTTIDHRRRVPTLDYGSRCQSRRTAYLTISPVSMIRPPLPHLIVLMNPLLSPSLLTQRLTYLMTCPPCATQKVMMSLVNPMMWYLCPERFHYLGVLRLHTCQWRSVLCIGHATLASPPLVNWKKYLGILRSDWTLGLPIRPVLCPTWTESRMLWSFWVILFPRRVGSRGTKSFII
jgi:hypothetical protein